MDCSILYCSFFIWPKITLIFSQKTMHWSIIAQNGTINTKYEFPSTSSLINWIYFWNLGTWNLSKMHECNENCSNITPTMHPIRCVSCSIIHYNTWFRLFTIILMGKEKKCMLPEVPRLEWWIRVAHPDWCYSKTFSSNDFLFLFKVTQLES